MYPDDYRDAISKISAREAWKQETLKKMRNAQAPLHATPPCKRIVHTKRVALGLAAALAVVVLPALYLLMATGGLHSAADATAQMDAGTGAAVASAPAAAPAALMEENSAGLSSAAEAAPEAGPEATLEPQLAAQKYSRTDGVPVALAADAPQAQQAWALVLEGLGCWERDDTPGNYTTDGLTALSCQAYVPSEAAPLTDALWYCFSVQTQATTASAQTPVSDGVIWVDAALLNA